ncbi:MAG: hypothetical protein AB4372_38230 [Xenococcus sp. (in: cyanobacteria)]
MEPISLIIAALVAGATKAASDIVPDTYNLLKTLIQRKFADDPKAEMVFEEYKTDSKTYEAPLKKKLAEAGADKDEEIITKALDLLKELKSQEYESGKFNVVINGKVYGSAIGNNNTVNNEFNF